MLESKTTANDSILAKLAEWRLVRMMHQPVVKLTFILVILVLKLRKKVFPLSDQQSSAKNLYVSSMIQPPTSLKSVSFGTISNLNDRYCRNEKFSKEQIPEWLLLGMNEAKITRKKF